MLGTANSRPRLRGLMPRPTTINVAMFLLVLAALLGFVPLPIPGMEDVPKEAVYIGWAAGILGLLAAYGLFKLKKWGLWLGVAIAALDGLAAAPGIFFGPTTEVKMLAGSGVVLRLATVILLLMKSSRSAVS